MGWRRDSKKVHFGHCWFASFHQTSATSHYLVGLLRYSHLFRTLYSPRAKKKSKSECPRRSQTTPGLGGNLRGGNSQIFWGNFEEGVHFGDCKSELFCWNLDGKRGDEKNPATTGRLSREAIGEGPAYRPPHPVAWRASLTSCCASFSWTYLPQTWMKMARGRWEWSTEYSLWHNRCLEIQHFRTQAHMRLWNIFSYSANLR